MIKWQTDNKKMTPQIQNDKAEWQTNGKTSHKKHDQKCNIVMFEVMFDFPILAGQRSS